MTTRSLFLVRNVEPRPAGVATRVVIQGNLREHLENSAMWSSCQEPEPCLAFAVTWNRRRASNDFHGYAVRVRLSSEVEPDHLALALGRTLQLAIHTGFGGFVDATTGEAIAGPVRVVGPVVEER